MNSLYDLISLLVFLFLKKLDSKNLNYKTQDNTQNIYKLKSCRAAEFSKLCWSCWSLLALLVLQSWSCLHYWWFADYSSRFREPLILFDVNWVVHRSLFPKKEEMIEWLNHISIVRSFGVVLSHIRSHFLYLLHSPSWFSVGGTCVT